MIRFAHLGIDYGIQFRHSEVIATSLDIPGASKDELRRITTSEILETNSMKPVYVGLSICHPFDPFIKDEGRRRSLTDALAGESDKTFRKAAWDAYFAR